jgi:hypothetical protein
MNALERLGLLCAAERLLGHRGCGAVLFALIEANGKPVCHLHSAKTVSRRQPKTDYGDEATQARRAKDTFRTRICWTREALRDVGLGEPIQTITGLGYAIPTTARSKVIARLIAEAG